MCACAAARSCPREPTADLQGCSRYLILNVVTRSPATDVVWVPLTSPRILRNVRVPPLMPTLKPGSSVAMPRAVI
jgi:hypothetical protein